MSPRRPPSGPPGGGLDPRRAPRKIAAVASSIGVVGRLLRGLLLVTKTGGIRGAPAASCAAPRGRRRDRARRADAHLGAAERPRSARRAARGAHALGVGRPRRRDRAIPIERAMDIVAQEVADERPPPRSPQPAAAGVDLRVRRRHAPLLRHRRDDARRDLRLPPGALFLVRYRRRRGPDELTPRVQASAPGELTLIGGLLTLFLVFWVVGATQYDRMMTPPPDAMTVYVTAKQWMWKFAYPDGRASIDVLTVPAGRPIKLVMTSRDVIHSFYVPAFRMKQDVCPAATRRLVRGTTPGTYAIQCAEYCGVSHSLMRGTVACSRPTTTRRWLETRRPPGDEPRSRAPTWPRRSRPARGCLELPHDRRAAAHRPDVGGALRVDASSSTTGAPSSPTRRT